MKQTILGAICLSLAASIWGGMYVVSKYVLDFIPPLTLVWLRFIIAFVVLYGILKIAEKKQKEKSNHSQKRLAPIRLDWIYRIFHFDHLSIYRNKIIRRPYRLFSNISYTCIYRYICSDHFKRKTNRS
ncbi:cysteine transporter [Bacillus anthracis str. UR-1]|nr:cysteine transporter [Bacillus anthracis str. UR-1]